MRVRFPSSSSSSRRVRPDPPTVGRGLASSSPGPFERTNREIARDKGLRRILRPHGRSDSAGPQCDVRPTVYARFWCACFGETISSMSYVRASSFVSSRAHGFPSPTTDGPLPSRSEVSSLSRLCTYRVRVYDATQCSTRLYVARSTTCHRVQTSCSREE